MSAPIWIKTPAERVATKLLQFTVWQAQRRDLPEIAERMGVDLAVVERYDRAIADLLKHETAPEAPGAATEQRTTR